MALSLARKSVVLRKYQPLLRAYSAAGSEEAQSCSSSKGGANAYEVLGLTERCSAASIRLVFRKLAKATHPDLQAATSTAEFIRVLAAYEILSDPEKRARYDNHLRSKRNLERSQLSASQDKDGREGYGNGAFDEQETAAKSTEVVSWLRSYRALVKDIIRRQEIGAGKGWEEELRGEMQSALKKAYFGPHVSEHDGLPECFEAEERAQSDLSDVLHLVSGRQLFGVVRQVHTPSLERPNETPYLIPTNDLETTFNRKPLDWMDSRRDFFTDTRSDSASASPNASSSERDREAPTDGVDSAFVDLELQMFDNVVARSIRIPFTESEDSDPTVSGSNAGNDCIYVYLSSEQIDDHDGYIADGSNFSAGRTLLGSIHGLGSTAIGSVCTAHGPDGKKTHMILQHQTPMVKHMQWFRVGKESATCECRCRRAIVLPSRYWIFEPRTDTHDVGGWYIETFGQKKQSDQRSFGNRDSDSSRERMLGTEGFLRTDQDGSSQLPELLHPAMYIMAAAYKTLDEEATQRRKGTLSSRIKDWVGLQRITSSFSLWWKRS